MLPDPAPPGSVKLVPDLMNLDPSGSMHPDLVNPDPEHWYVSNTTTIKN